MRARVASLPARTLTAIAAGVVIAYALALWFLVVSPKQAEANALVEEVATAELRLADARLSATRPARLTDTNAGDVLRLAKAMPSSTEQASLVLELELLGRATGLRIVSIAPSEPVVTAGAPLSIPVQVSAEGSYRQITRFLRRARALVSFRGGDVQALGRLFTVQSLELTESKEKGFPRLDAIIGLNAFVYDGPVAPVEPATPPPGTDDGDASTTTAQGSTS